MNNTHKWYIVKDKEGRCQIISAEQTQNQDLNHSWGPFDSQQDAIARRVGLIRAGKCQPL